MSDVAKQGVSAAKWSTITTLARFGLQLLAQIVLARLLGPDVYGVFGMGLVVFTFSNFLATFGFSWSLAQLKTISDQDIRFAFTWQMLTGLLAAAGLFLAAPWVADYFRDERVLSVTRWMALVCLLNAAGTVNNLLMRRDLNFKAIGLIQFWGYGVGYLAVGIPLALWGAGAHALVAAWVTQALVATVAGYWVRPHAMKPAFTGPQSKAMVTMGVVVFTTNLMNWLISSIDRMFIGRYLNAHAMGVYTAGYNLATMPNTLLVGALQPVFMAAGARVQAEPERLRNAYMQVMAVVWVLLLPFFVMLALMAPDVIALLYGQAWSDTAPVLAVLFLGMPGLVTWGMSTPVLWNTNRARHEVLLQLPLLPLAALAFYLFAQNGVLTAAAIGGAVFLARGAILAAAASRVVAVPLRAWLGWLARGLLLSGLLTALVLAVSLTLPASASALARLAASSLTALTAFIALLVLRPGVLGAEANTMLIRFAPPLKKWLMKTVDHH